MTAKPAPKKKETKPKAEKKPAVKRVVVKKTAAKPKVDKVAKSIPAPAPAPKPIAPPPPPPPASVPVVKKEEKPKEYVIETEDISVKDLADLLSAKPSDLIKELMKKGTLVNINQRINSETAREIGAALQKHIVIKKKETQVQAQAQVTVEAKDLVLRPPIVTIMGHVDHGKTKLLDAIRKTRVAEGEAGGITQHIGAYQVEVHGKKVTFLDTPGHEAFTALRARGAKVTDIAVLVVAADDGVKPQTIEAIDHAKAAGVPILVAINKVDKPEANLDRVKQQLADHELIPEEWGGKTVMVQTSAKALTGINELLEMILLLAEVQELKADPKGTAVGIVIESRLDKGKGPVADVLVKNGTLRIGDNFVIGVTYGKIKALFNDRGQRLESAGPATPVEVLGSAAVPIAGDLLQVVASEKEARLMAEKNTESSSSRQRNKVLSLFDFSKNVSSGEEQALNLVIKADVQGSMDAIVKSIQDMKVGNISLNVIHAAVGFVTESDIMLAKASDAIIACFNVALEGNAESVAAQEGVEIRRYNIIYKLIDDVKLALEGLLQPEFEEVVIGHAEVRNLFSFSKVGIIAGCFVKDGKMVRGAKMRLFRGAEKIYDGKLESLKRFKDDVKQVEQNYECGIAITGYTNFKVGDEIEAYEIREKARKK
jgi:translation initiation factor IF-2